MDNNNGPQQGKLAMFKINHSLLPVKAHYFFFMASLGPILPFLNVFGKQLGVSEVVMGGITAVLPIMFLIAKPVFGFIVDYFQMFRKVVFICLVCAMSTFYILLYFIPQPAITALDWPIDMATILSSNVTKCTDAEVGQAEICGSGSKQVFCDWDCEDLSNGTELRALLIKYEDIEDVSKMFHPCLLWNETDSFSPKQMPSLCNLTCQLDKTDIGKDCLYGTSTFWGFVFLMALGTIGFNVANSVSDAICFDVLGQGAEMGYGRQRVWGTIGFGVSAFLAGFAIDWWSASSNSKDYTPAFLLVLVFTAVDVFCCLHLKLPPIPRSENILKDMGKLLKHRHILIFLIFTVLAGIVDSFIVYFLFWYLEDLAISTHQMHNIKKLEGFVIAVETLVGEVIFFFFSGRILKKIGYGHSLTLCFFCYAIRLSLISMISNPWLVLPIEVFMQGPTYAMSYTTIVAYASAVSPQGASATMQGLVAGMDDGFGYAVGSLIGGFLYRWVGGSVAFKAFATLALTCSIVHCILYKCYLKNHMAQVGDNKQVEYKSPKEAAQLTS